MEKLIKAGEAIELAEILLGDPLLKAAGISLINHTPPVDVAAMISAEKQAAFRLGQMDMKESVMALLQDAASRTPGIYRAALLDTASMIEKLEVTS